MTRGAIRYCSGLTPIVVMASICSLTRMFPSSLAIVLPARAVTTTAARTGASSRASASATTPPTMPSAEKRRKPTMTLTVNAMPVKRPTSATMNVEPAPMKSRAMRSWAGRNGGRMAQPSVLAPSMTVAPRSSKNASGEAVSASNHPAMRATIEARGSAPVVSLTKPSSYHPPARSGLPVEAGNAARDARQDLPRDGPGLRGDLVGSDGVTAERPFLGAQHDGLVALGGAVDAGHVDHGHVHRDRADDGGSPAAHQDMPGVAQLPRQPVCVAHRHGRDARRPRRPPRRAVADRRSGGDGPYGDDLGAHAHPGPDVA